VLAWGELGLVVFERRGEVFFTTRVVRSPVHTAARLGGRWFASTARGISVLDCDLHEERRLPPPRAYCGSLCSLSGKLLWIADRAAFQLSACDGTWRRVGSDAAALPPTFDTVAVGRSRYLFAPRETTGGSLWTFADGRLRVLAEYDEDPWFRQSAHLPHVVATADRAGTVSIYDVAGRRAQ
jgi:hypothetical protein